MFTWEPAEKLPDTRLVYIEEDYSFDNTTFFYGAYYILFNYLQIGLNLDYEIVSVTGLCPHPGWEKCRLSFPPSSPGRVRCDPGIPDEDGSPVRIGEYDMFYDPRKGLVFVQVLEKECDTAVEFLPGANIVLRGNEFTGLLFSGVRV